MMTKKVKTHQQKHSSELDKNVLMGGNFYFRTEAYTLSVMS